MGILSGRILAYLSDPTVQEVTVSHLQLLGVNAVAIQNCQDMEDALKQALPDAVLIDLDFDEPIGLRWVEQIASNECTAHVPIMCLSTGGKLQDLEEAFKCGAQDFLIIPYDPILLEDKLETLILHQHAVEEAS